MLRNRNKVGALQLIAGVLLAGFLLINLNSLDRFKNLNDDIPDMTMKLSSDLASIGDKVQVITEDGFLQSFILGPLGLDGDKSLTKRSSAKPVSTAAYAPESGGIGERIEGIGSWFVGLWSAGEASAESVKNVDLEQSPMVAEVIDASESFEQVHQPYISNVPIKRNKEFDIEGLYLDAEGIIILDSNRTHHLSDNI